MDGVLLIDKPAGPTSHDVVARMRRATGERSIGHTGTLDPLATGLLPLVLGRATRLASLLTGGDKTYDAAIRLGFATDTDDADGAAARRSRRRPARRRASRRGARRVPRHVRADAARTTRPRRSAGQKAYDLARRDEPVALAPVDGHRPRSSGSARGRRPGPASRDGHGRVLRAGAGARPRRGARAAARTWPPCGGRGAAAFDVARRAAARRGRAAGRRRLARTADRPADALPHLPAVTVTEAGLTRALHGNPLGPGAPGGRLGAAGRRRPAGPCALLAATAAWWRWPHARGGALHPVVVLG